MNLYRAIGVTTRIANVSMTGRVATCHPICMSEPGKLQLGKHHGLAKGWFPPPSVKKKQFIVSSWSWHLEICNLANDLGNLMLQILKGHAKIRETNGRLCTNPPAPHSSLWQVACTGDWKRCCDRCHLGYLRTGQWSNCGHHTKVVHICILIMQWYVMSVCHLL